MDIEVPAANPRSFSHITRHGRHILQLESVLMTIYYPSAIGSGTGNDPSGHKHWSREVWLPHPRSEMSKGYAVFAQVPQWLMVIWFFMTVWFTKLPAFRNTKLANHWPPEQNPRKGGFEIKATEGCTERATFPACYVQSQHGWLEDGIQQCLRRIRQLWIHGLRGGAPGWQRSTYVHQPSNGG